MRLIQQAQEQDCEGIRKPDLPMGLLIDKRAHRRYLINTLVVIIGMGSCISANGLSAETPLMVMLAPEGSKLPANGALVGMIAMVGPILYAHFNRSSSRHKASNDFVLNSGSFILSTLAMGIIAFCYNVTITINTSRYSIVLLSVYFVIAAVTGMRSILLMPYLRHFDDVHLTSFFIGDGLSGFVPSIVALIQGVGADPICPNNTANSTKAILTPQTLPPKFSPREYYLFLFVFTAFSTCAFWLLAYLRVEKPPKKDSTEFHRHGVSMTERDSSRKLLDHESMKKSHETEVRNDGYLAPTDSATVCEKKISNTDRICLYALMFFVSAIANAYLNCIEVFSARPYGNSTYHLAMNLSQLAGTVVYAISFWLPPPSIRGITPMVSLIGVCTAYVTWLALSSPHPLWRDTTYGAALLVTTWVLLMSLVFYARLAITAIIWEESSDAGIYQLGFASLCGTTFSCILSFVLIHFTSLFTPYSPCTIQK